ELFVGESGDEHLAVDVFDRGDGVHALAVGLRSVGQRYRGVLDVVERALGDFAGGVDAEDHGHGIGAFAARDGDVHILRSGIDDDVVNGDLVGGGSQHRGDLLIDALDFEGAGRYGGGAVVDIDGIDGGAGGIADKQDAVGADSQGARRFQPGL